MQHAPGETVRRHVCRACGGRQCLQQRQPAAQPVCHDQLLSSLCLRGVRGFRCLPSLSKSHSSARWSKERLAKKISSAPDPSTVQAHKRARRTNLPRIPIQSDLPARMSCSRPKLASSRRVVTPEASRRAATAWHSASTAREPTIPQVVQWSSWSHATHHSCTGAYAANPGMKRTTTARRKLGSGGGERKHFDIGNSDLPEYRQYRAWVAWKWAPDVQPSRRQSLSIPTPCHVHWQDSDSARNLFPERSIEGKG